MNYNLLNEIEDHYREGALTAQHALEELERVHISVTNSLQQLDEAKKGIIAFATKLLGELGVTKVPLTQHTVMIVEGSTSESYAKQDIDEWALTQRRIIVAPLAEYVHAMNWYENLDTMTADYLKEALDKPAKIKVSSAVGYAMTSLKRDNWKFTHEFEEMYEAVRDDPRWYCIDALLATKKKTTRASYTTFKRKGN